MTTPFRGRARATQTPASDTPSTATADLAVIDPEAALLRMDIETAATWSKADIIPKAYQGKPANIAIALGLGRSLGFKPATALYQLHVIDGTPSPSARAQASLARQAGHKVRVLESDATKAVVQIVRCDDPDYPVTVTYTIEDATEAGLLDQWCERWAKTDSGKSYKQVWKLPRAASSPPTQADLKDAPQWARADEVKRRDNWFTNRAAMLVARATTTCVGQACPEVVMGIDYETAWDSPAYDAIADDEPVTATASIDVDDQGDTTDVDDQGDTEVVEAEVVEDPPVKLVDLTPREEIAEYREMMTPAQRGQVRDWLKARDISDLDAADDQAIDELLAECERIMAVDQ